MSIPSGAKFKVGAVDLTVVNDGMFWQDAGAVFGLVPPHRWTSATASPSA